ncbi:MAG: hypothetical protein NTX24_04810 [Candidatus Pacearchaeota archaeon]|nr:hypothetical protein [Candidatus Pacearchaeota archaeon]
MENSLKKKVLKSRKLIVIIGKERKKMVKNINLNLRFLKINYLNNICYYIKEKNPKEVFTLKLINFFKENFDSKSIFNFQGMNYRFGAVEIGQNHICGKLWELKKKHEKDYPWTGTDYEIKPQLGADYRFAWFYIDIQTKHLVLQDERDLTPDKAIQVLCSWFDDFHGIKEGINIQYLKSKKDFLNELKEAYKIVYAKFILYPSNFDYDGISKPLDDSLHALEISEMKQEIKSNNGVKLELDKPNVFSSSLAQALRGNGKDPEIKTQDKKGNITILTKKMKHIKKQIQGFKDINDIKKIKPHLIAQLKEVIKEMDNKNESKSD